MSKLRDVLDKVLPALGVMVSGDFLREPGVSAFFHTMKYREFAPPKDTAAVMEEMKSCTSYTIWCSLADDQFPFGPTLTVRGQGDETGKITIPWSQIIAIVQLHERFAEDVSMGFGVPAEAR
jgi:hypothetical protein